MTVLNTILTIVFIILSIVITVIILMQEGKSAGLGAIAAAETKTYERLHIKQADLRSSTRYPMDLNSA